MNAAASPECFVIRENYQKDAYLPLSLDRREFSDSGDELPQDENVDPEQRELFFRGLDFPSAG